MVGGTLWSDGFPNRGTKKFKLLFCEVGAMLKTELFALSAQKLKKML
jgi:hypothetical protein